LGFVGHYQTPICWVWAEQYSAIPSGVNLRTDVASYIGGMRSVNIGSYMN